MLPPLAPPACLAFIATDGLIGWLIGLVAILASLGILVPNVLYPVAIRWLARSVFQAPSGPGYRSDAPLESLGRHGFEEWDASDPRVRDQLPSATVLLSAYQAEEEIVGRIENLLACDYPADRLHIVVVSDGSQDGTVERVQNLRHGNVRVKELATRHGKLRALQAGLDEIESQVVMLTDVAARFRPETLLELAAPFIDAKVAVVSGELRMVDRQGHSSEGMYWKWEAAVRAAEGRLGLCTGVSGAVYAMRRECIPIIQAPTINDDMVWPLLTLANARSLGMSCGFVHAPLAIAEIAVVDDPMTQMRRRRRISLGVWQALPVLIPRCGELGWNHAIAWWSHKVLRWLGPLFLLAIGFCALLLWPSRLAVWMGLAQCVVYGWAGSAWLWPQRVHRVALDWVRMNWGMVLGFADWLANPSQVTWDPSRRRSEQTVSTSRSNPEEASHAV